MTLIELFWIFTKTVALTFGGGYAAIPLFQYELVLRHGVLSNEAFANLLALAQLTPGPVGLNAATYCGYLVGGVSGAVVGTAGVAIPCLIMGIAGAYFWHRIENRPIWKNAMTGIRPMTLGLIFSAVLLLAESSVFSTPLRDFLAHGTMPKLCWQGAVVFVLVAILELKYRPNFILMILGSGVLSFLLFLL